MADFRAEPMPTSEGEGRAKTARESAIETYYKANKAINKRIFAAFPEVKSLLRGYANSRVFDLFGFWLLWHISGGFEGMQKMLGMSRTGMYRRIALFREVFGEHPDVFEFPGITINPAEFAAGMADWAKNRVP